MRRIRGIAVALVSAMVIVAPVAQASPAPSQELSSQAQPAGAGKDLAIQGWAFICRRYETVGVRHFPGGPAFVQLRGGTRIYVDDYNNRVWVHITQPYHGWILYSTVCQ
jgi:hypothetical protein